MFAFGVSCFLPLALVVVVFGLFFLKGFPFFNTSSVYRVYIRVPRIYTRQNGELSAAGRLMGMCVDTHGQVAARTATEPSRPLNFLRCPSGR